MALAVNSLTDVSLAHTENPFAVGTLPNPLEYIADELYAEIQRQAALSGVWGRNEPIATLDQCSSSPIFKPPGSVGEVDVWLATVLYASRAAISKAYQNPHFDQILRGSDATNQKEVDRATREALLLEHGDLPWQEQYFGNAMVFWATVLSFSSLFAAAGIHSIFVPYAPAALPADFDPLADSLCGYLVAGLGVAGPALGVFGCAYTLLHSDSTESVARKALTYLAHIEQR